ncbi:MAG TPA: preprotein translocase subunit SecA [Dehalococcoidia bacterium]|nr:preprotein translocase subunit SecA [Dehalococcoidia bacterium]|tara:strand:+ start:438 stop:2996 length:2559 start_codon:yes stop_codon:yes gene_type:complete
MVTFLKKLTGDSQKIIKKSEKLVALINELEDEFENLSDTEIDLKVSSFKEELSKGKSLDDVLVPAFALVREIAKRTIGQRHYDVQLIGGIVLHNGQIAEMKTGEGKTLVATLPAFLNALSASVHVVTVNDYLAMRDAAWMGPIYQRLGLSVGCLQNDTAYLYQPNMDESSDNKSMQLVERKKAYAADVLYGTNNEFGFDYLRDNMAVEEEGMVQKNRIYAIVDEVDNILIDEARTPLIISGPAEESANLYADFAKLSTRLSENQDFTVDDKTRGISLTEEGIHKFEQWLKVDNLYDPENFHLVHFAENAVVARYSKQKNKDYVIRDGEIVIVDEFTGRLQQGRRWSDGLHQAIEAKEGVMVQRESVTYATITLQNYFRLYSKLCGMTGTASTESEEFYQIYGLEVAEIPTNLPMQRADQSDLVFQNSKAKWQAIIDDIANIHASNRPVLIGTASIEDSEYLSDKLKKQGVKHNVLNAKNHANESGIIAEAGKLAAVTVSTNMAGRGTDILLGGASVSLDDEWKSEHEEVISLGGLHVIGVEHYDSRRIDNQLRGRAGRQGDPGTSQFYVSLEDDLMHRFGGERIKTVMSWTGLEEDVPIENKLITRSIRGAQVKVEGYHFDIRKHLLNYDDVLNNQRTIIYQERNSVMSTDDIKTKIIQLLRQEYTSIVEQNLVGHNSDFWDLDSFYSDIEALGEPPNDLKDEPTLLQMKPSSIMDSLLLHAEHIYEQKSEELQADNMNIAAKILFLKSIDSRWLNHLTTMENLRTGVGLHAYGQRDPLVVYKGEGFKLFKELLNIIQTDVLRSLFNVHLQITPSPATAKKDNRSADYSNKKTGRNETCPCGSGKKFKRCHG